MSMFDPENIEGYRQRNAREWAAGEARMKSQQERDARIKCVFEHGVRNMYRSVPNVLPPKSHDEQWALAVAIVDAFLPVRGN